MNVGKPNNDITTLYDADNDATNVVASSMSAQFTHAPIRIGPLFPCRPYSQQYKLIVLQYISNIMRPSYQPVDYDWLLLNVPRE